MTRSVVAALQSVLVFCAVAVQLLCALGLLKSSDPFDRLHLQAPAALLGVPLIALAICLEGHSAAAAGKALLIAFFLAIANPLLCYYTANAFFARDAKAASAWEDRIPDADR